MNEWVHSVLSSDQAGIVALAAVFLLGVISVFTCACNFAVLGVLLSKSATVIKYAGGIALIVFGFYLLITI